jgi:hypothetical protein
MSNRTNALTTYEPDNSIRKGYASIASELVNEIVRNFFLMTMADQPGSGDTVRREHFPLFAS